MSSASSSGTTTPKAKLISNLTPRTSSSLKRKLQVFIEVPHSPFRSPASHKGLINKRSSPRSSLAGRKIGVPLSAKQLNNGHISNAAPSTESMPPFKKAKLSLEQSKFVKIPKKAGKDENQAEEFPNGFYYCHQCGRRRDNSYGLRCTFMKGNERCQKKYCKACMKNRYGESVEEIVSRGAPSDVDVRAGHVSGIQYVWKCPQCADNCNCSRCRKAKGLEPTGKFTLSDTSISIKGNQRRLHGKPSTDSTSHSSKQSTTIDSGRLGSGSQKSLAKARKGRTQDPLSTKGNTEKAKPKLGRPKKSVPEPKWDKVPTELSYTEVEDRFLLREFILRFSPLMSISAKHLEDLDEFDSLTDAGAKSLIMNLLSLVAADADPGTQKSIRDCHKRISAGGFNPSTMWTHLAQLRDHLPSSSSLHIPDPLPPATGIHRTRAANSVTHCIQLLPILIALVECAMVGASAREEIEHGAQDAKEENRRYYAAVKEENERWAAERDKLLVEKQESEKKPNYDPKRAAQLYRDEYKKHKARIFELDNAHVLKLQACAPRFKPLGTDAEGRTYYVSTSYEGKTIPSKEERSTMKKWSWFLAVWGRVGKPSTSGLNKYKQRDDDMSSLSDEEDGDGWWGFTSPSEIRKLATWIAAKEGLDMRKAHGEEGKDINQTARMNPEDGMNIGGAEHDPRKMDLLGVSRRPTKNELKTLVKNLNEYADFLAWRCGESVDATDDEAEKSAPLKKIGKGKTP